MNHPITESKELALRVDKEQEATARRAAAFAIRHVRNGWDMPGILKFIDEGIAAGYDFATVVATLIDMADDSTVQNPGALLARLRNGWRRDVDPPSPKPPNVLARCKKCQIRHPADGPCGNPRRGSESAQRGIAECRQALTDLQGSGIMCGCGIVRGTCKVHRDKPTT